MKKVGTFARKGFLLSCVYVNRYVCVCTTSIKRWWTQSRVGISHFNVFVSCALSLTLSLVRAVVHTPHRAQQQLSVHVLPEKQGGGGCADDDDDGGAGHLFSF